MGATELILFLVIGAIAGWLAGELWKGHGFGLLGNIVVGIVGAFLGGFLLGKIGVTLGGGILGSILTATIGALVLLLIIGLIKRT
jgi:uncharacterized membrane protein YeaQ/YmgE (transglycosylase-associated protein family)